MNRRSVIAAVLGSALAVSAAGPSAIAAGTGPSAHRAPSAFADGGRSPARDGNDAPSFTLAGNVTVTDDSGPQTIVGFATGSAGPPDEAGQTLRYVIDAFSTPAIDEGEFSTPGSNIFTVPPAISPAGDLTFTPRPAFGGIATVTVHLVDSGPNGNGDVNHSQEQSFLITVEPVQDPPVAVADTYVVRQGGSLSRTANDGVLSNDAPARGLLTAVLDTDVSHGTLTLHADGSFTYSPTALYVGPDSFTYHARHDISGVDSTPATVSITVYVNHPPVAVADQRTVIAPWDPVDLGVLANDDAANPDPGESLVVTHVSRPGHGTVGIEPDGTDVFYRPTFSFVGTDVFSYTISDGVSTATATVHVKVLRDQSRPVTATPSVVVAKQLKLGASTVALRVTWHVSDVGTGDASSEVWRSVNGHAYTKVRTVTGHSTLVTATIGSTVRFRVRTTDRAGNVGLFAYAPRVKVNLYQETAASYLNPWHATSSAVYTGGHVAYTSTGGFDATFTASGRSFAWIGARSPTRGSAAVFVDGIQYPTVELGLFLNVYRAVLFTVSFPTTGVHTIRIVCTSPGRRIDIDGFVVVR